MPDKLPALTQRMQGWDAIVIDTETTSVEVWQPAIDVLGIGFAPLAGDEHYYVPINHHEIALNPLDLRPMLEVLERKPLIGHNIKFDLHVIDLLGWQPQQEQFMDVIVAARLYAIDEHPTLTLDYLSETILKYKYVVDLKRFRNRLRDFSINDVGTYCLEDVYVTKMLYLWFREHLAPRLLDLFVRECQLTRDLYDMERRGILVDEEYLSQAEQKLNSSSGDLLGEIRALAHAPAFNPRSPKQVQQLMTGAGIQPVAYSDRTAKPSWDREALLLVRDQHPVAMALAKYRGLMYQRSGMVQRCRDACATGEPVLHFDFKNWGTVTGRMSGNSQQMPKGWLQLGAEGVGEDVLVWAEGEAAQERDFSVRRLLRPRPGYIFVVADYRQIEMYVLGFYLNDPTFTRWLESGNVHAAVALEVWGVGSDDPRYQTYYARGKEYNFAMVFGLGNKALALRLGCTEQEATQYREDYFSKMPGHTKFLRRIKDTLQQREYVHDFYDRRYYIDPNLAYKGVNYIVQGSSGDYVKFQLPATRALRRQLDYHVLNTTHDDFVLEVPLDNLKGLPDLLHALRQSPFGRELELDVQQSKVSLVDMESWEAQHVA